MKEIEFNLLTEPWIRVRLRDNTVREVSLTEALVSAQDYVDLAGEMPTQDAAELRLLLAGIPRQKIRLAEDEFAALELLPLTPGDDVYLLYGGDGTPLAFRVREKLKEKLLSKEVTQ